MTAAHFPAVTGDFPDFGTRQHVIFGPHPCPLPSTREGEGDVCLNFRVLPKGGVRKTGSFTKIKNFFYKKRSETLCRNLVLLCATCL
jgi:hypothetical protein